MTGDAAPGTAARAAGPIAGLAGAGVLAGVGIGSLAYRYVSERLIDDDTFVRRSGYADAHTRTDILHYGPWVLIGLAVVVALVVWRRDGRGGVRVTPAVAGAVLFGAGVAWFAWSSLDMHGLELYDWPGSGSHLVEDVLWHGGGAVVAGIGWVLLTAPPRSD